MIQALAVQALRSGLARVWFPALRGISLATVLTKIFGSRNQRLLRRYEKSVKLSNALESELQALSDAELKAKTDEFKKRLADGTDLDALLPEAFAVVREASVRALGLRHFDVQLVGGLALYEGNIAEMRTGEGKTLVATLPTYLNALPAKGVHIVTVNEYLAQRDSEWMAPVYEFLGLTVGVIKGGQTRDEKRAAYAADITYGTNNEFGFDYLRDNLALHADDQMQREQFYAVIDEVDSILIDEARTPLIISGPSEELSELYIRINKLIPYLVQQTEEDGPGDFSVDEKSKQAFLTEDGHQKVEDLLAREGLIGENETLYDAGNIRLMHHLTAAMRAHALYKRDVEYVVKEGEIVIVDEFTGRTMTGRRWSDGLHQAIEAKEGVAVQEENQTVASITFQNYFRMYDTLAGMTGTADSEAFEFQQIYGLEVVVIPTHRKMIRDDQPDLVYLTRTDKFAAIIDDIRHCQETQQPVLVGTTSIEVSEYLSGLLKKEKIRHEVLNAKQHEREAQIVIDAGRPGAVTIATNMAGRGTDIVLGGNLDAELKARGDDELDDADVQRQRAEWQTCHEQVIESGGLHIIGTERHESRRIDNQLRGRSGRQGDAGSSRFYLSLEDNLMRIFGDPERTKGLLTRVGMQEGEAIESKLLTRQIERAQVKVEAHNFDSRKQLLEYDDVSNDQRYVVYQQRNELMHADDISDSVSGIREEVIDGLIGDFVPVQRFDEEWDVAGLQQVLKSEFGVEFDLVGLLDSDDTMNEEKLGSYVTGEIDRQYDKKVDEIGEPIMRQFEKVVMLTQLDTHWKGHLAALDYLRQGIHLRGYAQKNPKQEYKREAFEMFGMMLDQVKREVVGILSRAELRTQEDVESVEAQRRSDQNLQTRHAPADSVLIGPAANPGSPDGPAPAGPPGPPNQNNLAGPSTPFVRPERKVGRNEPCPCGSGKKYKQCHGRIE